MALLLLVLIQNFRPMTQAQLTPDEHENVRVKPFSTHSVGDTDRTNPKRKTIRLEYSIDYGIKVFYTSRVSGSFDKESFMDKQR